MRVVRTLSVDLNNTNRLEYYRNSINNKRSHSNLTDNKRMR